MVGAALPSTTLLELKAKPLKVGVVRFDTVNTTDAVALAYWPLADWVAVMVVFPAPTIVIVDPLIVATLVLLLV